jgi:hypothetical protein
MKTPASEVQRKGRLRGWMVAEQIAVCLALLIGASSPRKLGPRLPANHGFVTAAWMSTSSIHKCEFPFFLSSFPDSGTSRTNFPSGAKGGYDPLLNNFGRYLARRG